jgi:DNA-binding response OmpR family regulator
MSDAPQSRTDDASARVLVGEPYPEVRSLVERVLAQLGHEAVAHDADWDADGLPDVDVLILEPSLENGAELVDALRRRKPELPVICTASHPPAREVERLAPMAYLVKPFALAELEEALRGAVAQARARTDS